MLGKAGCAAFAIVVVSATGLCCTEENPWDNSPFSAKMATASVHWDSVPHDTEHSAGKYEGQFGSTFPPMVYLRFCTAGQWECQITDVAAPAAAVSTARWKMLYEINNDVASTIIPVTGQQLWRGRTLGLPQR